MASNDQLRALRECMPSQVIPSESMSRHELAEAVNAWLWVTTGKRYELDAHRVARFERGAVRWPGSHYRAGLRHVLGVATDADLGFRPGMSNAAASIAPPSPNPPPPGVAPWLLADSLTRSSIDGTALDHMERAVYDHARLYPSTPPHTLWPSVSAQIAKLNDALTHPQPQRVRRRAATLLGVLSGIAGNLWLDFNQRDQADRYFDIAELAAHEADTPDLAAWALASRSIGPFFAGDSQSAAELLARADHQARQSSPRRRAWISALLARASAANGDIETSRQALDDAYRHADAIAEPASGTEFFDAARLDGVAGITHVLLRDTERARPLLHGALQRRAPEDAKGRALLGLDLAECALHDGNPDEAGAAAVTALDWATGVLVEPIIVRAQAIRAGMARLDGTHGAQDLDARLAEAVRER